MNNRILTWSTNIILYLFIYTHCSISKNESIIWGKAHYILGNMRLKSSAFFSLFFNSISHFSQMFTWRINICVDICIYKKIFFFRRIPNNAILFFSYKNLFFFSQLQNNSSPNRMCRNKAMLHFFNVQIFLDNFSTFGNFFFCNICNILCAIISSWKVFHKFISEI